MNYALINDRMARDLAHEERHEEPRPSDGGQPEPSDKALLNRREYVLMGTAAAATLAGAGLTGRASGQGAQTFATDFSEYAT